MTVTKRAGLIVALLLVAALVAACGGGGGNESSSSSSSSSSTASGDVQRIEVSGVEFAFNPSNITVQRGTPVEIVFKNDGRVAHDLVAADLNARTPVIAPGRTATIQFTPTQAGQYKMVCTEPGHEASGMVGTITVQ